MKLGKWLDTVSIIIIIGAMVGLMTNLNIPIVGLVNKVQLGLYILVFVRIVKGNYKLNYYSFFLIGIFIIYCLFNSMFSQNINQSIETLVYLGLNTMYAFFLYERYGVEGFISIMVRALSIIMISSFVLCIILPDNFVYYDINYDKYVWKGVFTHKNTLGNYSALAILFIISNYKSKNHTMNYIFIVISIMNLLMSNSNTPLIALLGAIVYMIIRKTLKKDILGVVSCISILISYIYMLKYDLIMNILLNFNIIVSDSGRYGIFKSIIDLIKQRLFLGYGIGSCWMEGSYTYNVIYNIFGFNPNSAHNGFLDIVFNIGFIGFGLYIIILMSIVILNKKYCGENYKFTSILIFLLVLSIFESTLSNFKGIYWVIQMFFLFSLCKNNIKSRYQKI